MVDRVAMGRNLQVAMDNYLNDSETFIRKYQAAKPKTSPVPVPDKQSEYDAFFRQYAGKQSSPWSGPEGDVIDTNGLLKLYGDLGLDMTDPVAIVLSYHCNMQQCVSRLVESQDQMTKAEFRTGMSGLGYLAQTIVEPRTWPRSRANCHSCGARWPRWPR